MADEQLKGVTVRTPQEKKTIFEPVWLKGHGREERQSHFVTNDSTTFTRHFGAGQNPN